MPLAGVRANVAMACSISLTPATAAGLTATSDAFAPASIVGRYPVQLELAGLNRTITRVVVGAIALRMLSHFPASEYSSDVKPVILRLGCAKLSTKPLATGSATFTNTIGIVVVSDFTMA